MPETPRAAPGSGPDASRCSSAASGARPPTAPRSRSANPATGDELARWPRPGPADLDARARHGRSAAFTDAGVWSDVNATDRGRVLLRVAALLRERLEDFARAEVHNAGHTIGDARWEAGAMADVFEYYAGAANKHLGSVVPTQDAGLDVVLREPVGRVRPDRAVELPAC